MEVFTQCPWPPPGQKINRINIKPLLEVAYTHTTSRWTLRALDPSRARTVIGHSRVRIRGLRLIRIKPLLEVALLKWLALRTSRRGRLEARRQGDLKTCILETFGWGSYEEFKFFEAWKISELPEMQADR